MTNLIQLRNACAELYNAKFFDVMASASSTNRSVQFDTCFYIANGVDTCGALIKAIKADPTDTKITEKRIVKIVSFLHDQNLITGFDRSNPMSCKISMSAATFKKLIVTWAYLERNFQARDNVLALYEKATKKKATKQKAASKKKVTKKRA